MGNGKQKPSASTRRRLAFIREMCDDPTVRPQVRRAARRAAADVEGGVVSVWHVYERVLLR